MGVEPTMADLQSGALPRISRRKRRFFGAQRRAQQLMQRFPLDRPAASLTGDAPADPDLALIVARWPTLPAELRIRILAMTREGAAPADNGT